MLADPSVGTRLGEALSRCCASDPAAANGPLLVVHGEVDESLPLVLSDELVADLCAAGVVVDYRTYPGAGHDAVMAASSADTTAWMSARLAGEAAPSNCDGAG